MAEKKVEKVMTSADYYNEKVKIKLPRMRDKAEYEFVSLNAKTYRIKRGVEVEVPRAVAKMLEQSEELEEKGYELISSIQN